MRYVGWSHSELTRLFAVLPTPGLMCAAFSVNHGCVTALIAVASTVESKLFSGLVNGTLYTTYTLSSLFLANATLAKLWSKWCVRSQQQCTTINDEPRLVHHTFADLCSTTEPGNTVRVNLMMTKSRFQSRSHCAFSWLQRVSLFYTSSL